ncbi:MAG: hypothetical protein H0W40_19430 [Methylibium sp.]|uniref:hypothetical protein n=1 Tax=Methylibium sp. TaxID=2067992 RepID=UPI0017D6A4E9|nr:hypothetical protein [Methylibium sp.]MBA3599516.1 hypothetical protein [Methylibium sp.]
MSDPIIHIKRVEIELKLKGLCEQLEKQNPPEMTQHLRGQITVWRQVLRYNDPPRAAAKSDQPPVAMY